jgi:hypothetical protein
MSVVRVVVHLVSKNPDLGNTKVLFGGRLIC